MQALRVTHYDYDSSFSEPLEIYNKSTLYGKNIKVLMTGIYKFFNDLSHPIMNYIFQKRENYYF